MTLLRLSEGTSLLDSNNFLVLLVTFTDIVDKSETIPISDYYLTTLIYKPFFY